MSTVKTNVRNAIVYRGNDGWFWQLWIDARLVIVGWCETEERAQTNARMA